MRIIPMVRIGCCVIVVATVFAGKVGTRAADQVGVQACDALLTQYEACNNAKMPKDVLALHQNEVDQWRTRWIDYGAKNPSLKSSLGDICKNTATLTTPMVEFFGCSFQ